MAAYFETFKDPFNPELVRHSISVVIYGFAISVSFTNGVHLILQVPGLVVMTGLRGSVS